MPWKSPCRALALLLYIAFAAPTAFAQTLKDDLAKPPAAARHYPIQSTAGPHGESWIWTAPDGTRMGRESINLRGQVFELDSAGNSTSRLDSRRPRH
jgi:hypothetical protein